MCAFSDKLRRLGSTIRFRPHPTPVPSAIRQSQGLRHPLPAGMRDLLPAEAGAQAALARRLSGRSSSHGYELVTVPIFEYASVLEEGWARSASTKCCASSSRRPGASSCSVRT